MIDQTPEKRLTATEGRSGMSQAKPKTKLVLSEAVKEIILEMHRLSKLQDLTTTETDRTSKPKRQS